MKTEEGGILTVGKDGKFILTPFKKDKGITKLINRARSGWRNRKMERKRDKIFLKGINKDSKEWKKMSFKERRDFKRRFLLSCHYASQRVVDNLIKGYNETTYSS